MASPFVHLELTTRDTARAKDFYGRLFDWTFTDNDMGGGMVYSTFKTDAGPGGGMMTMPGAPTQWLAYVGVDDVHAATAKAKSLGAAIVRNVQEIPDVGWFSIFNDPTGAMIAIFQTKAK